MTIQVPNPGTGNGATGDNEFVLWSKVKANFEDQSNAASRLVGGKDGELAESIGGSLRYCGYAGHMSGMPQNAKKLGDYSMRSGFYQSDTNYISDFYDQGKPHAPPTPHHYSYINMQRELAVTLNQSYYTQIAICAYENNGRIFFRNAYQDRVGDWIAIYNGKNTTLDSNGALKPSSPVLRVFSDMLEGNDDGNAMAATYTKNGIGDYTISGTTGLRSDGWYIVVPNDMNGNPKVAVTLDDTDGVITLKTYARIFDMSTFKFVPDLNQPLDIPDGRWVDLRFNDLPIDELKYSEV